MKNNEKQTAFKIYYDKHSGLLCNRYPTNLAQQEDSPFIEVEEDVYNETLSCDTTKLWTVHNGNLVQIDNKEYLNSNDYKKQNYENELNSLYEWFEKYDMQVKEYLRDVRLQQLAHIHIDNKVYKDLNELDKEADSKQKRVTELRELLGR